MSTIADITPGTQVRITTDGGAPFINEGDIVTVVDPDAHWEEFLSTPSTRMTAELLGLGDTPPPWPEDAIAVDHPLSMQMGPGAFREGEFEVIG